MKKYLSVLLCIGMIFAFSACGGNSGKDKTAASEDASSSTESTEVSKADNTQSDETKAAVVYFSATGNTEEIAKLIASETGADIYEIIPADEYSSDDINYNDDDCRANSEMNDESARPEIGNDLSRTEEYDVIYLGYPIWWGTAPRIIETYLESCDLSGAEIYTFCTSGGSSIDKSISDLQENCPDLNIVSGKRLNGASASDIDEWMSEIG